MKRSGRKDIIDKMVSRGILTPDGARALVLTLDPFHDTNVTPIGLPDELPGSSVVQVVKQTINLSAPAGMGANALWDTHICTLPELATFSTATIGQTLASQVVTVPQSQAAVRDATWYNKFPVFPLGPVVIASCDTGASTFPDGNAPATHVSYQAVDYSAYQNGQSRLIGLAFEVHNTTADIFRQGTCTSYRLPQDVEDGSVWFDDNASLTSGNLNEACLTKVSRLPPATAADAMLLPDSKQWEAAHGAYAVATFDHSLNRPAVLTKANRLFQLGDYPSLDPAIGSETPLWGVLAGRSTGLYVANGGPAGTVVGGGLCKPTSANTTGCFFTGLSQQTTLTLTVHAIIETFPSQYSTLVTLARPTPDYDANFFVLYKEVCRDMPPACMVAENASGDFWDGVLNIVEKAAPVLGSILPIPGASLVGNLVSKAASTGRSVRNEDRGVDNKFTGSNSNAPTISSGVKKSVDSAMKMVKGSGKAVKK